jgi:hypothetical protein
MEERSLEYWCDMMIKTYNTSVLDNFPQSLKSSLAKQCVESKPNPNSYTNFFGLIKRKKNRNVLMRLINNYFRSKQVKTIPTVDFIGGPHTLTLHWSDKYKKIIYIFGEYHRTNVCDYDNMMRVEDYLKNLFRHSGVFIDFFLEMEMFIKGEYKYTFSNDSTTDFRLDILKEQNKKCIETRQRQENRECDTKRVHFIDIRQDAETEEESKLITKNSTVIFMIYFDKELEGFAQFKHKSDELYELKMIEHKQTIIDNINYIFGRSDVKPLLNFILSIREETDVDFWKKVMSTDEIIKDELIKSTEETYENAYEIFLEKEMETHEFVKDELSKSSEETKIREFAKEAFKTHLYSFISSIRYIRSYFTTCYDEKSKICDFNKLLDDGDYLDFFHFLLLFNNQLFTLNSILVDVYTLARIFKKFHLNHTRNMRKTDEPEEPHNIIMYAGDNHSERIRRFLYEKLNFELMSASKGDPEVDFCVDIRNFEQPFFSSWPPKKTLPISEIETNPEYN